MPNLRWLLALVTIVHRAIYRASGGRLGLRLGRVETLLLETVGRRTGRLRVVPLLFVREGDDFVVVGSNAGDERPPAWWLNLRARPEAEVQVGRERHAVRAREATGTEAVRLWERLEAAYPDYARYRQETRRHIPVVILEPRASRAEARPTSRGLQAG